MKSPIKMKKVLKKRNVSAWLILLLAVHGMLNRNNNEHKKKTGKGLRRRRRK